MLQAACGCSYSVLSVYLRFPLVPLSSSTAAQPQQLAVFTAMLDMRKWRMTSNICSEAEINGIGGWSSWNR
jgi:hypothetical protein